MTCAREVLICFVRQFEKIYRSGPFMASGIKMSSLITETSKPTEFEVKWSFRPFTFWIIPLTTVTESPVQPRPVSPLFVEVYRFAETEQIPHSVVYFTYTYWSGRSALWHYIGVKRNDKMKNVGLEAFWGFVWQQVAVGSSLSRPWYQACWLFFRREPPPSPYPDLFGNSYWRVVCRLLYRICSTACRFGHWLLRKQIILIWTATFCKAPYLPLVSLPFIIEEASLPPIKPSM